MTDGVRPIDPVRGRDRRDAQRRSSERRRAATGELPSKAVVRVQEVVDEPDHPARPAAPPVRTTGPDPAFAAQLIGQGGQRKGIRGGPPVMDAARSAYLGNEYSGENDRRPATGGSKKTDV